MSRSKNVQWNNNSENPPLPPLPPPKSFGDLARLEPGLTAIEADVKAFVAAYRHRPHHHWLDFWAGVGEFEGRGVKARIARLVGWSRLLPGQTPAPRTGGSCIGDGIQQAVEEMTELGRVVQAMPPPDRDRETILRTDTAYTVAINYLDSLMPPLGGQYP